ncbi:hypothetical protein F444_07085 [Phytophthora nicotianae P1976]|uniref:NYN domain-containing protein n=1 Tax=Phytophthora nicotianae P1976 TaxID=1317066 RepID=A0A081AFU2_PHYNI|nr:hypothetical protein F444_07085 [Phytophthora nicotianae P1976]
MTVKRRVPAVSAKTTALIIDGAYARIQSRILGGKIDFMNLRAELEEMASTEFEECWYFDSQRKDARGDSALASEFHALKYARPRGPQFQVDIFSTKLRNCRCTRCGHGFTQNVQKGVDNGIATKLLTLTLQHNIERVVLLSGDGDFYTSLGLVRNALQREVWVVGFPGTVSGDLQQLASQIIWVDDIWGQVKYQGRRGSGRRGWRGLGESHSSRSHHHRSRRSRGHRDSGSHRHRHDRSRSNDVLSRRERSQPRREVPLHESRSKRNRRSPSPRQDSEEERSYSPLFDEVNLSCSDGEDEYSCPSQRASRSPSESGVVEVRLP